MSTEPHAAAALRFTHSASEPQSDKRQEITGAVYNVARACGWEVLGFHWDKYPMSFHWVDLKQGERRFALLIHESSPFVALTSAIPDYFNLAFMDDAAFVSAVERVGAPFRSLPASDLRQPLTDEDREYVRSISDQHERDLKYWKPETVGDVIFNWWD
ncbi:MAG: hypothetical protein U1E03_11405 [Hyphomonadaceae bacterium]